MGVNCTVQRPAVQLVDSPENTGAHARQPTGSLPQTNFVKSDWRLALMATTEPLQPEQQPVPERSVQS